MLLAIPVFNEEKNLPLFGQALFGSSDPTPPPGIDEVLFINDGSTDASADILSHWAGHRGIRVLTHGQNQGYGQAMISAMTEALSGGHSHVITMDCDRQHSPEDIHRFLSVDPAIDVVSGSRYLPGSRKCGEAPADRIEVNARITERLNRRFGFALTDAFCGFKRYRMERIRPGLFRETGYAFPLEFWAFAAEEALTITELAVSRIYTTDNRSFGEDLDRTRKRYHYYLTILARSIRRFNRLKA